MATERYIEAVTASGMVVSLRCPEDKVETVKAALAAVRELDVPAWREPSQIAHGGYGGFSRYELVQHCYAGSDNDGGGGYIEVLEIKNPPEERHNIVLHSFSTGRGHDFGEFENVETAQKALGRYCVPWNQHFADLPGIQRYVPCGWLTPWFYAIGQQVIIGDYALAPGLEDHPLYTLGRLFVVTELNERGIPAKKVKRCLGCRRIEIKPTGYRDYYDRSRVDHLVYWDDSSCTRIGESESSLAIPYTGEIEWIREAAEGCRQLLAGGENPFRINLTDGRVFIGCLAGPTEAPDPDKPPFGSEVGTYLAEITFTDNQTVQGTIPYTGAHTPDYPSVVELICQRAKRPPGVEVLYIKLWPYDEEEKGIPYDQRDKPVVYFSPAGQLTGS